VLDFLRFLFPEDAPLQGRWERIGDRFAGCIIEVEPEKNGTTHLRGRILALPAAMSTAGWIVGDIKWHDIRPAGKGVWELNDLRKHFETQTGRVIKVDFQPYHATVGQGSTLRLHTGGLPFFPDQTWIRQTEPEDSTRTHPSL